jgi:hypothetical protein
MSSAKKATKRHETNATHSPNEGAPPMTTTKHHATTAHKPTHEGETSMKTTATATESANPMTSAPTPSPAPGTVSPASPSAAALSYIETCTSLLDQLEAAFPPGSALTAKEKKHRVKARKGGERYTPQLVALAKQHGVNLSLVPLDGISNASDEATALVPFQKRLETLTTRAASRLFTLQSTSWSGSSKLYSVLKRLSKDSGDIQSGLAPVEQFFNHRHPSVAKNHPKTKRGKAAKAEKAAAEAAAGPLKEPVVTPVETPVAAPAAAPEATPVPAPVATPAGAGAHS